MLYPILICASALSCSGKIVFYTHPPEQHSLPSHLSADIVSEWSKEFDIVSYRVYCFQGRLVN